MSILWVLLHVQFHYIDNLPTGSPLRYANHYVPVPGGLFHLDRVGNAQNKTFAVRPPEIIGEALLIEFVPFHEYGVGRMRNEHCGKSEGRDLHHCCLPLFDASTPSPMLP
jgi:hypothetical protein